MSKDLEWVEELEKDTKTWDKEAKDNAKKWDKEVIGKEE
ncbi:hypothetical protein LCGC14_0543800 [marine sediment metagenome]|uniref:Uncharacterized protein n=1 Tax=marine sediment metagenome TaxID=412755 RepID=A0A0F9UDJ0_9ZZZZ